MNDNKLDFIFRIRTRLFIVCVLIALFVLGLVNDLLFKSIR